MTRRKKIPARTRNSSKWLIRKALSPEWTVEWEKVKYDKVMDVKYELLPSESYRRQYFRKPEKYANEREWRLVITFKRTDRIILNETLKFHFSELVPSQSEK